MPPIRVFVVCKKTSFFEGINPELKKLGIQIVEVVTDPEHMRRKFPRYQIDVAIIGYNWPDRLRTDYSELAKPQTNFRELSHFCRMENNSVKIIGLTLTYSEYIGKDIEKAGGDGYVFYNDDSVEAFAKRIRKVFEGTKIFNGPERKN